MFSVAAFLHENYLNFIDEEAIEDVTMAASYMSDAGELMTARRVHRVPPIQGPQASLDLHFCNGLLCSCSTLKCVHTVLCISLHGIRAIFMETMS